MTKQGEREGEVEKHLAEPLAFGLRTVALERFRNYGELTLELDPGFNVLAGPNAQGKTNFLEALYLLSTTRLLRGQRDAEAIQEGSETARVEGTLLTLDSSLGIKLERGIRKRATLNGMSLPRASDLIGRLPSVCVSTVDMAIAKGEPADRRLFLDLELSALYPAYLRHFTQYKRALDQRNALLKQDGFGPPPVETFEPWEIQLARHGEALRRMRSEHVERLTPPAQGTHCLMGSGETLELAYAPRDEASDADDLFAALARTRPVDLARGTTTIGPHRDDLTIMVGGRDARLYGSQGQQRTAVISLKLAGLEVAQDVLGAPPMLLLDDILSDLDERRRAVLVEVVLSRARQAVLTCTEASAAGEAVLRRGTVFQVRGGTIVQE